MAPIPSGPIKVAILDDYQGIATSYFEGLKPSFEYTLFPETLLPYNHPSTPEDVKQKLVERLKPFAVISSMRERTPFPASLLEKLPNLRLLVTTGGRNAAIDLKSAKALNITVTGAGGDRPDPAARSAWRGPDSTTQHTVAMILGISRNLAHDDKVVKEGGWQTSVATSLGLKTFGILGLGRLGISVGKIMHQAFGMRLVAWSASLTQEAADLKAKEAGLHVEDENGEKTIKVVTKEELFKNSDFVSLHYVLSERSKGLVGATDLALMKRSAFFINSSRGPLVDEAALLEVLKAGRIRGAAIDVFELEPLAPDSLWRTTAWGSDGSSQVLLTPHMGYVEEITLNGWYRAQVENIRRWHQGQELLMVLT